MSRTVRAARIAAAVALRQASGDRELASLRLHLRGVRRGCAADAVASSRSSDRRHALHRRAQRALEMASCMVALDED